MVVRDCWWRVRRVVCLLFVLQIGCGPAAKPSASPPVASAAVSAAAAPERSHVPEPARKALRAGPLPPVKHAKPLELSLKSRVQDGTHEILELSLPAYARALDVPSMQGDPSPDQDMRWAYSVVRVEPGERAFAFAGPLETPPQRFNAYAEAHRKLMAAAAKSKRPVEPYFQPTHPIEHSLWIRRPISAAPIAGTLYTAASSNGLGRQIAFSAAGKPGAVQKGLIKHWVQALANRIGLNHGGYFAFAERRLAQTYLGQKPERFEAQSHSSRVHHQLASLMDTTSGRISLQAALEVDRPLLVSARRGPTPIAIEKVKPPNLAHHDWAGLVKALGKAAPEEALARATPADFYFVRSREVAKLFDLIDELEEWGQPLADWIDGHAQRRDTFERYQIELGLARTGLASILGPRLVSELALVGSDPYVHQGTDITLIIRPKEQRLFTAALGAMLATHSLSHGGTTASSFVHEGVTVNIERSADGRVRRHWASSGGLEIVSNSANAIRRVLSTVSKKAPSLADEPDFRYLLARDAGTAEDVLAYAGDRFVANVVGPAQKIAEARRQLAFAELSVPGYAALLAGTIAGRAPATLDELLATKLLTRAELVHAGGGPIAFAPGKAASSSWGTPAALEPLIDLPPVTRVSELEQSAYREFALRYQQLWSDRIDPIALRLRLLNGPAGRRTLVSDLRVLPLLHGEYRDYLELVGAARIIAPPLVGGARALFGIGADARLRQELGQSGRTFLGSDRLEFDWIGDYAGFGVENRNEALNLGLTLLARDLERPEPGDRSSTQVARLEGLFANFPIYGFVAIKNPLAMGVALTILREKIEQTVPGMASWQAPRRYRNATVVEVKLASLMRQQMENDGIAAGSQVSAYYALTPSAFVISLNAAVLERVIDRLSEQPVVPGSGTTPSPDSSQFVIDLAAAAGSALSELASLALTQQALRTRDATRAIADAVIAADPVHADDPAHVRTAMRAAFGSVVLTPEGREYEASPLGARDPLRGTPHAPIWPALPVPGSPLDGLFARLRQVRTELAFDDEPAVPGSPRLQSLHARVTVGLEAQRERSSPSVGASAVEKTR
jgi:hypothetical protein